jgi:hypothetical protein
MSGGTPTPGTATFSDRRSRLSAIAHTLSREHAIPAWVAGALDDMEPCDGSTDWFVQYNAGGSVVRDRQHPVAQPTVLVRAVCELRNNGWMFQLESDI